MKISIARALFNALNLIKNFEPGITSRSKSQLIVDYEGERYLIKACKESIQWVKDNLNPHQQLIITLEGVKVVSEDCFIPSPQHPLIGKQLFVVDQGGRYTTYQEFYDFMKKKHPNLPPYAEHRPMENKLFEVIDVHKHLDRDLDILVLVNNGYTYLLTDIPHYYKEVV